MSRYWIFCFILFCFPSLASGDYPFRGAAPVLRSLSAEYERSGTLSRPGSFVMSAKNNFSGAGPDFDFSRHPFYERNAIYVGMKCNPWGLHFSAIVRNKRLDVWKKGNALFAVFPAGVATLNGEPVSCALRESWRLSEFGGETLANSVPPASYGIVFKIPVGEAVLSPAERAMQSVVEGEWTQECVTPPLKVLVGAGIEVPGLDWGMNVSGGLIQTLVESLLYETLRFDGKSLPVSLLISDHAALIHLARYWADRDAAVRKLWDAGKLWDKSAWEKLSPPE